MRLPADAALLVIDAQHAVGARSPGADDASKVETNIAALIAAWRAEALPLVHVGRTRDSAALAAAPLNGEIVIVRNAASAFVGADLEATLDELGATTLVLCGALATRGLEASAWHATDLGYQVFVVADACLGADVVDLNGRLWPADDVWALALGRLKGEAATIVDVATTLRAAATAKVRQRRAAGKA
jgi:nicotinamidase-related amidase